MKFVKVLSLLALLVCAYSLQARSRSKLKMKTHTKAKTHMKMKNKAKSNFNGRNEKDGFSLMDMITGAGALDALESSTNNASTDLEANVKKREDVINVRVRNSGEKANNTIQSNNSTIIVRLKKQDDSNIFLKDEKDLELFKESWLTVAYRKLESRNVFPTLNLPDFTEAWIKTGSYYRRKNNRFDPSKQKDPNFPPTKNSFYVRLSGKNLFYSEMKDDLNILGSLPVNGLERSEKFNNPDDSATCFKLYDKRSFEWTLCAIDAKLRNEWVCLIKKLLNEHDKEECKKPIDTDVPITYFEKHVKQPILLIPLAAPYCNANWNYNAHGVDWECTCKEGRTQSPIDLPKWKKAILSPVKPLFNYEVVEATTQVNTNDGQTITQNHLKIQNKDHSVQINHNNFGNIITLDGAVFNAEKIVFHTPAEHTINGKKFDMEMQIIHYGQTKGDIAKQVILSFLFTRRPGMSNSFIDDLNFFNLPTPIGTSERLIENNLYIPKIFYDTEDKDIPMMNDFSFYTYEGSLTAPPCSERTIVYVASEPIAIGSTALGLFEEALRIPDLMDSKGNVIVSDILPLNNRAIQPRNGRNVFFYKKDEGIKLKYNMEYKEDGHYEKLVKTTNNYYFVNNDKPSNMPGAIVVSKEEATGATPNWG